MNKIKPKISILMASYKHKVWLSEAIESVLNQTYDNFEFIIVDDESVDGSAEIIKSYAKKDKRVKYEIFSENRGAVTALKRCYDLSSCDYIAIMNSDDVWELNKLEKQVAVLNKHKNIDIIFGLPSFIDDSGKEIKTSLNNSEFSNSIKLKTKFKLLNSFFFNGNCLCHPTILIKKECYEKHGFYKKTFRSLPDFEMWVRLFWHYNVVILNDKLIKFRRHSTNESGYSISNIIRVGHENKIILNIFLNKIQTIQELEKIFPEYKQEFKIKNDLLVPFYIARIAMKRHEKFAKDFAFDILYKEMEKENVLSIIEENNLYSLVQLNKELSQADIYSVYASSIYSKNILEIPFLISLYKIGDFNKVSIELKILNVKVISLTKEKSTIIGKKHTFVWRWF
jgi:glycosyltransferase involved in cell wall biosynthesis